MKIVSVIIPTYNRARYIEAAIESVLNQELPEGYALETIVADDGSTDDTKKIIDKFNKKVTYLNLPHSGKPATPRNAAIRAAKGDIIAFQDSDDLWAPGKLMNQLALFKDPKIMFSFGQAQIMNKDGVVGDTYVVNPDVLKSAKSYGDMLTENPVCTLTAMVRKYALDKVGLFNESDELRAIEDYELWLRIANAFPNGIRPLYETLAFYRRHDQNISAGDTLKGIENALKVYEYSRVNPGLSAGNKKILEEKTIKMMQIWSNHKNELDGKKSPDVSIVMSVYNGGRFLRTAIESILAQTYENFEFIIINDGSTDKTEDIVNSFSDKRIRLINQQNHGLVHSLNKGILIARGEFIARMDADDISLPKRLEKELTWLKADKKRGLVSTYFSHIDFKDGKPTGTVITLPIKHIDLRRAFYTINPFAHGASMYRKRAVIEEGLYRSDYGPTEDYELWRRLAKKWQVGLLPEILFQYRINNPGSVSQSNSDIQAKFIRKIHDELWRGRFVHKFSLGIVVDYFRIDKQISAEFVEAVKKEYINQQIVLARFSLLRGFVLRALEIMLGLLILKPSSLPGLMRLLPKGVITSIKRLK